MSLFRRIWLAVVALTIAAFVGSLLVNTLTARSYLEKQLYLKNVDNATALALSMSQFREKDPVTIELLVSAQFDTGHYTAIRLIDPAGKVLVERKQEAATEQGAPDWFVRLFTIQAKPGVAHVQDGWKQFGTITLQSHGRFAYEALWLGTLELLVWFAVGGVLAGVLGSLMLRLITRPLNRVVEQAHAISQRKFVSMAVPKVPELRSVALAMNDMVERLKQMFADESARLESLRKQANHDAVTGLPNREFFLGRLRDALSNDNAAPQGWLALVRLTDLVALNNLLGHAGADKLLKEVADTLSEASALQSDTALTARLRGADFALLIPDAQDGEAIAEALAAKLGTHVARAHPQLDQLFHIGVAHFYRTQSMDSVLANADHALATAEMKGRNAWHVGAPEAGAPLATSGDAWRHLLVKAMTARHLKLAAFPVRTANGVLLHQECVLRMQLEPGGSWLPAGDFMPMAERLKQTADLDLQVVKLALEKLRSGNDDVAINLSVDSIADWGFHNKLIDLLKPQTKLCKRLWVEVAEQGVFRQPEAYRDLCHTLKNLGCRVGVEHVGHRFDEIAKIADLGLDYLKVDGGFIHDIHAHAGNREFLQGMCKMAHSIGISVIAEGVHSADELAVLPSLGFDGVTGAAVS